MGAPAGTLEERLWRRVVTGAPDECWPWLGYVNKKTGYGAIREGVFGSRLLYTHRVAWESLRGPIPPGMTVDHLVGQRNCCNPDHMEIVSLAENGRRGANRRWHPE